ncbi:MAG: hypothetical protein WD512_15045 [Candidatus Paceibacterota bacterium]
MQINAVAKLCYWNGESISGGRERLELEVKFKEPGKWFSTKLRDTLVVRDNMWEGETEYETFNEYVEDVNRYLNDTYLIKMEAGNMIRDYFEHRESVDNEELLRNGFHNQINALGKINLSVNVDVKTK